MAEAADKITIPVPIEQVFDFAADVRNVPLWVFGVREVMADFRQPLAEGDRLRLRLLAGGTVTDSAWEIGTSERPRLLTSHGRALGATATLRIECRAQGDLSTEVGYLLSYQLPAGPLGALAGRLGVQRVLARQARSSLGNLRRLLIAQYHHQAQLEPGKPHSR